MKVADIMTRNVVSVAPDATIRDAVELMLRHRISGLPVIDAQRKLVGIVSEGDFLRRPETGTERQRSRWLDAVFGPAEGAKSFVQSHGMQISEVMTGNVVAVMEAESLDRVVHLMEIHRIKRLPVLREGKVVGIVSRANLLRALASVHRGAGAARADDTEIRGRILAEIERQSWAAGADVDLVVRKGLADLWGTVADPAQRDALQVLAEGTPGIKSVVSHLRWDGDITPT
jgi:CBS domain-containing protein